MNDFPIFRKIANNKSFYKINSLQEFEEIQLIGSKTNHFLHLAKQYPEKLKIMDMIAMEGVFYEISSEIEWNSF